MSEFGWIHVLGMILGGFTIEVIRRITQKNDIVVTYGLNNNTQLVAPPEIIIALNEFALARKTGDSIDYEADLSNREYDKICRLVDSFYSQLQLISTGKLKATRQVQIGINELKVEIDEHLSYFIQITRNYFHEIIQLLEEKHSQIREIMDEDLDYLQGVIREKGGA